WPSIPITSVRLLAMRAIAAWERISTERLAANKPFPTSIASPNSHALLRRWRRAEFPRTMSSGSCTATSSGFFRTRGIGAIDLTPPIHPLVACPAVARVGRHQLRGSRQPVGGGSLVVKGVQPSGGSNGSAAVGVLLELRGVPARLGLARGPLRRQVGLR